MSFFSDLLGHFDPSQLFEFVLNKFPKLRQLFDLGKKVVGHFTGTLDAGIKLFDSIKSEIDQFRNFKEDISFKQRCINLETAVRKTKELVQGIFDSWRSVLDIIKSITTKLEVGGAAEVVEAASGIGLPVALVNAIVLIVEILDTVRNVIDDLQTIVDEVTRVREFVEHGDTLFLQQRNPRKTIKTEDGKSVRIRIGHLHPG